MPDQFLAAKSATSDAEKTVRQWQWGITIALLIGIVWLFGSQLADYAAHALDNGIHIVIDIAVVAALYVLFTDNRIGTLVRYMYSSLIRKLAGVFCTIDPIGIRETYRDRLNEKLEELTQGMVKLRAQKIKTEQKSETNKKSLQNEYHKAEVAKQTGNREQLNLESSMIARLESLDQEYTKVLGQYSSMTMFMTRYRELCTNKIADIESDIAYRKEKQEFAQTSNSMISGAKAIMKGMPAEQELYDQAGEVLDTEYTDSLGRIEDFLDDTKSILSSDDLQNSANVQALLDKLNKRETTGTGAVTGTTTKALPIGQTVSQQQLRTVAPRATAETPYDDLLK